MLLLLLQEWGGNDGAVVPIQCVLDVVGNAFNTNDPGSLPVVQDHLLPLIQDSNKGPAIDLDALLLVLLEESLAGTAWHGMLLVCGLLGSKGSLQWTPSIIAWLLTGLACMTAEY